MMKLPFKLKLPEKLPSFHVDIEKYKSPDPATSRQIIVIGVAIVVFMIVAASASFFLALRGAEQTMVPDLRGKELTTALVELQEKELYPRIQLRTSSNPSDRGTVLEQSPGAGAIVRAGRRISLVVSKGAVVSKVDNFVGQGLAEVQIHFQSLVSSTSQAILTIKDPPIYVYDAKPVGTILQQKPLPDSPITAPVQMEFVVSRGPEAAKVTVPNLSGQDLGAVLASVESSGIVADFSLRDRERDEAPLSVVSELPAAGATIPTATRVSIVLTKPAAGSTDKVFGLLSQSLPEYPYPLKVSVDALLPSGAKQNLYTVNHPGGSFTCPYLLPDGSQVILSILGQEKMRQDVKAGQ